MAGINEADIQQVRHAKGVFNHNSRPIKMIIGGVRGKDWYKFKIKTLEKLSKAYTW